MKTKRILSLLLSFIMAFGMIPAIVLADDVQNVNAEVYLTVSDRGVIASDNDGKAMLGRKVTVTDENGDGKLTVDEALSAAHKAYNNEDGYASSDSGYGLSVTRLWGVDVLFNTLFFINGAGLSVDVGTATVKSGDKLVASVNLDNTYYADWYTFFDSTEKTVNTDEEFTLTLKGHLGMSYDEDVAIPGISVGIWENGVFSAIEGKITDENGSVTLSFSEEGTYYVSATGTVSDSVQDWNAGGAYVTADCPIIAPGCVVTVEKPSVADAEALDIIYKEFSGANTNKYTVNATPLIFPLEYEGTTYTNVISYIKARALKETGRELEVQFDYVNGGTSYTDWTSGVKTTVTLNAFDEETEIINGYFKDNSTTSQRLSNVYFTVGSETSERIASIYVKATSMIRNERGIVDFVAKNIPFSRIQGKNTSADEIVQAVGESTATSVGALPTSDSLYTKAVAKIEWSLENVRGKTDALKLSNNKITVSRPGVGEEDAVFNLLAKITSVSDPEVSETVSYRLTVPAFEEIVVPIQVTEGATLSLTDKYYNMQVDSKYIVKQENAPEGFDLYHVSLHTSATGTAQSFSYVVEKENYITQSGNISVTSESPDEAYVYSLTESSDNDTKLGELSVVSPTVSGFDFDPDVTEYTVELSGAVQIKFSGNVAVGGAGVKITSYYSSLSNANSGKLTTSGKALTTTCYLPDAVSESVIKITVTAPEGSVQENKTREYTVTVRKTSESEPLTGLSLTASSTGKGIKNNVDAVGAQAEETLSPVFVSGGNEGTYYYTVNYFRDRIKVKPTAAGCTITVNGIEVASGKNSEPVNLEVGDNEITVSVAKGNAVSNYKLIVHRKRELLITNVTLDEGTLGTSLSQDGSGWTGSCNFASGADTLHVTYYTNITENVTISVSYNGNVYTGVPGEPIELPVGNSESIMPKTTIIYKDAEHIEAQSYVISFRRVSADAPSSVEAYLPAPGQFVNLDSYLNPGKTLSGSGYITLGAFGGNVVYKYDEPIRNDPNNPYGIDFIVMGNAFTNSDGSTSAGAAEPAAVVVSKDGENWFELAGSQYYEASSRKKLTVTYTNGDTDFSAAADIPWTDSDGESGIMPKNSFHNQPYYPNPEYYSDYQNGVGKNSTYTYETVSFTGTMIDSGFYPFGYADSHTEVTGMGNKAANPYTENHEINYNGDGFDLAWAVDENGNPVNLDEISYIRIYNPVLSYSASTGEKSPEIRTVLRAMSKDYEAGISDGLASLVINGENVEITEGIYSYEVDGGGADSLIVKPQAVNADANIYVSAQRVKSGEDSTAITAVNKFRIIVQDGEKEPVIYIINMTNVEDAESNASLTSVTLTPGDDKKSPDENGKIDFAVANGVSSIRFAPESANKRAKITLSGGNLNGEISLTSGNMSNSVSVNTGENVFTLTVKSVDETVTNTYTVTVTRAAGTGSGGNVQNTIRVSFSLTGDTIHYDADENKYTSAHTNPVWITSRTVEIPKGSTVKYVTEMLLNNAGLDYSSDGIYISEIDGIGEFDNGPSSGWMFRHNGYIAEEGYATRTLESGDTIKWFYSDDYTKESNYEGIWDDVNSGNSGWLGSLDKTEEDVKETEDGKENEKEDTENIPEDEKEDEKDTAQDEGEKTVEDDLSSHSFSDVRENSWYEDSVDYVVSKNLFKGVSETEFAPDSNMTRAMLVTVLYRLESPAESESGHIFTDVEEGQWYTEAVLWAAQNGIVQGMSDTHFAPEDNITREQLAVIVYRYAKLKGYDTEKVSALSQFTDTHEISEWAIDALKWANGWGLVNGTSETNISPSDTATRAQVAAILMRFCENTAE